MLPPFSIVPCIVPEGMSLAIVPRRGHPHGPLGRCGHTILETHSLIIRNGIGVPVEVIDTSAMAEHQRDESGIRRPGWFGGWFGISPHRCDSCKRKRELQRAIVCPCCRNTILRGDAVSHVPTALVEQVSEHQDLRPFFVATEDGQHTVVCAECGEQEFDDQEEPAGIWTGEGVMVFDGDAMAA